MDYSFKITEDFWNDLNDVIEYISTELYSPAAANRMAEKVYNINKLIKENPFMFPLHHRELLASKGFRFAVVGNYLILYRVLEEAKTISVDGFVHGSQNIEKMYG
jgi:plasmid stabilization system protein ParE